MKFWPAIEKDPFRLFFPLGALFAFAGILPWIVSQSSYPRELHRLLMIDGFLLSFVAGFLMTAVPRFTGAKHAGKFEISAVFVGLVGAAAAALCGSPSTNMIFAGLAIVALIVFGARRFRRKKSNPPFTFVFIGIGLILWMISLAGQVAGVGDPSIFQDLFSNGAIMSIVLGVGGRLIPGILGWQEIVSTQRTQYEKPRPFLAVVPKDIWFCVAALVLSFFLRGLLPLRICFLIRAFVALYFGLKYWSILKLPRERSFLTYSIWICCWCLALGYFLPALWIGAAVHALHFLLIGGISLLTLLVSTRVVFAHSGRGPQAEKTTRSISVFTALILLAMITRVTAILWPAVYLNHLSYAAFVWILALCVWLWLAIPKIIKPRSAP